MNQFYESERFAHFPLEIDMTKSPTILTRRSIFRAGAGLAVAATATPLFTRASASAEDAHQPGAEALRHLVEDRPFGKVVLAGGSI